MKFISCQTTDTLAYLLFWQGTVFGLRQSSMVLWQIYGGIYVYRRGALAGRGYYA